MQLFFTTNINGELATLSEEEARHCFKVLRKRVGDQLHFVDGLGNLFLGSIIELSKKNCTLNILKKTLSYHQRDFYLHIAIAPTKNINRFEWFLEKATEIGIDEITPLLCKRSERKRIRTERLNKIIISAMKQSLKAKLPKLNELQSFTEFIKKQNPKTNYQQFIAHCEKDNLTSLQKQYSAASNVCIMIGPEGDFSKDEIQLSLTNGYDEISLGTSRLRTETAGIVACHTVNLISE